MVVVGSIAAGLAPASVLAAPADPPPSPQVDWWDDITPSTPDDDPVAPPVTPTESAPEITDTPFEAAAAATLPAPGLAELTLGSIDEARKAGDAPLELSAASRATRGTNLQVEVLDQALSRRAGISGFAFRVLGQGGTALTASRGDTALPVNMEVDYSGFKDLYGGGYSDRLRVVALPECALLDPVPEGCNTAGTPLPTRNDRGEQRLVVDVANLVEVQGAPLALAPDQPLGQVDGTAGPGVPSQQPEPEVTSSTTEPSPTTTETTEPPPPIESTTPAATEASATAPSAPAGGGMVLAVMAAPEGPGGSFKATPFGLSGDWQVGIGSGAFSWNQTFTVPQAPVGATPEVNLSYSSGAVDGMVTSQNAQAGQAGLGWSDFNDSFIERRYNGCRDEGMATGDLCWATDNASISLNGQSSELVAEPGSGGTSWRLKADPRWRVQRLLEPDETKRNADNDGEHWIVTTPDGTTYEFGLGRNPDGGWLTGSVWTVPVWGDDANEPCKTAAVGTSWCMQAWRWNLDRVVDPNGNTQVFRYGTEINAYAGLNGWPGYESMGYVRSGWLEEISYGRRDGVAGSPAAVIAFETSWRCSTLDFPDPCPAPHEVPEGSPITFPDVPLDLQCSANCALKSTSPTFWSIKRYTAITTHLGAGDPVVVDTFKLAHEFGDADGDPATTDDIKLWLSGIQRTGHSSADGSTLTLPATSFESVSLNNRFNPGEGESAMPHWRVGRVTDEFGRQVNVTYSQPHPCQEPADPEHPHWDQNTRDCFPQLWAPEGQPSMFRAFNKYVVTQVEVKDTTGGSPAMVSSYAYGDQVQAGAPNGWWHHADNDEFAPQSHQSWSQWRGYQDVLVTQGTSKTRYKVHTGMDDDRIEGGYRNVTLASLDGTATNIEDSNWLAGRTLDEVSLGADGTTQERGTVHRYLAVRTVNATDKCGGCPLDLIQDARWVGENDTIDRSRTPAGAFARRRTEALFNGMLLFPEQIREHGWTDQSGDERCTQSVYASNGPKVMIDYPSSVTRYATLNCTGTPITRAETAYDGGTVGAPPTHGNPTLSRAQLTASPVTWATTIKTFDALGRPDTVTDPNGNVTDTDYGGAESGGYPATIEVTNPAGQKTKTWFFDPAASGCQPCVGLARQLPLLTVDPNGNQTNYGYDALGRVTSVRQPTEQAPGSPASWEFSYDIHPSKAEVPVIRTRQLQDTLGAGGTPRYLDTWAVFDSLLRERQTQRLSPASGKVIVAGTSYDERGLPMQSNLAQAVDGPAGNAILPAPGGIWANRTATTYDALSRPVEAKFFVGASTTAERTTTNSYTHNSVEVTPAQGGKALTVTDAYDRTVRVEEHDGTAYRPAVYTYDSADSLRTVTDAAGNKITYSYDMAGRRLTMDDPDGGDWSYAYDPGGNQISVTDAAGVSTFISYDQLSRPTQRRKDNPDTGPLLASWAYDALGEQGLLDKSTRHTATGDWVIDISDYDARNRPTGRTWTVPAGNPGLTGDYPVSYSYNAADQVVSVGYPGVGGLPAETVTTNINSIGMPETMASDVQPYVHTSVYDDRGRPNLQAYGDASGLTFARVWTFNANQELSRLQAVAAGVQVQDLTVAYDKAGNVTERGATLAGQSWRECFGYDQRQRLVGAYTTTSGTTCASGNNKGQGPQPYNHTYSYNHAGNMTSRTENGATTSYTYPASGPTSTRPHAPTAVGSNSYTWDANGNQATRTVGAQTETLQWDAEHRLAGIDDPDGDSAYVYDPDGQRLLRQDPTGTTLYFEAHEVTAPSGGGPITAVRSYNYAGSALATRNSAGLDYLATDNQGSIQLSVPNGSSTATVRTHQPYGKPRHTGQHDTQRGWIGQTEDTASGLTYLNARYYDPTTAVFMSPDPLGQLDDPKTLNPYSYSANNPTTKSDPSGERLIIGQGIDELGSLVIPPGKQGGLLVATNTGVGGDDSGDVEIAADFFEAGENVDQLEALISAGVQNSDSCQPGMDGCSTTYTYLDPDELLAGLIYWQKVKLSQAVAREKLTNIGIAGCGFLPVCGEILDLWDAVSSAIEGNWDDAGLSTASLFVAFGSFRGAKALDKVADGLGTVGRACTSFDENTAVLMADKTRKPISRVQVGDWVWARDPRTGEDGPRQVIAVWIHADKMLELETSVGDVVTTEDHPFWNATDLEWQESQDLDAGDLLLGDDGDLIVVERLDWSSLRVDTAYNLTVDDIHTYFVEIGAKPVLVHNTDCDRWASDFVRGTDGFSSDNIRTFFGAQPGRAMGPAPGNPAGDWYYHTVVVKDGKVYQEGLEAGVAIDEYKAMWDYGEDMDFGF